MHSLSIRDITKRPRFACATLLVLALLVFVSSVAHAQTTVFTYQGRLNDGGSPANGVVDMQFRLYDAADPSAGAQIGSTITNSNVALTNGIFTVRLDFGASALPGANRFLEVGVRRLSSDPYTVLAPRQQVTPAPYAIRSANAVVADQLSSACVGCVQDAQINAVAGSKVSGPLPAGSIPAGNSNYIQNTTSLQGSSNFNITGNGTVGGNLSSNIVNATTQYNIGSTRVLSTSGLLNLFVGVNAGQANTGSFNSFFGAGAGQRNTTAARNSFFGSGAGLSNTGSSNSFFGTTAGQSNTTGARNSFFGDAAGLGNLSGSTGSDNSFFGNGAGQFYTTGGRNSFFGTQAGQNNGAGFSNSFFGSAAGFNNSTGSNNAFFGADTGNANTRGSVNAFFGDSAGFSNQGDSNAFFGFSAGKSNTVGGNNAFFGTNAGNANTTGSVNAFFGDMAGFSNRGGDANAFFGAQAGRNNGAGSNNAFFGNDAGFNNTTGINNTFIGTNAGSTAGGSNNTFIGYNTGGAGGVTNATAIGAGAQAGSNQIVLGTSTNTVIVRGPAVLQSDLLVGGTITVSTIPNGLTNNSVCLTQGGVIGFCNSSLRYKTDVQPLHDGLDFVRRLRPVTYKWKANGIADLGLIAEEVNEVEPLLVTRNGKGEIEGVKYNVLNVVLINAIKEQQAQIEQQQRQIDSLKRLVCLDHPNAVVCQ